MTYISLFQTQSHTDTMENTAAELIKGMMELASFVDTRLTEFEKSQQQAPSSNTTVKGLSADYMAFKALVWKTLGMLKTQLQLIVDNQDRLETHSRRKVLLLHGVPEENSEDLSKKILGMLHDRLKLTSVNTESIEACHRLGAKKDKNRPVLIRFVSMQHRSEVWRAKTAFKGSNISISEFLTKSRQDIFAAARKHFGMRDCWTADGNIIVVLPDKSRKKVQSMSELQLLLGKYPPKNQARNVAS